MIGRRFRELLEAQSARVAAEERVLAAVRDARVAGVSWAAVGSLIGTSGEAARQRFDEWATRAQPKAAEVLAVLRAPQAQA